PSSESRSSAGRPCLGNRAVRSLPAGLSGGGGGLQFVHALAPRPRLFSGVFGCRSSASLTGREPRRQQLARPRTVRGHLYGERLDAHALGFEPQEMVQRDLDLSPVEIACKI